jgi:shikimate kinase
MMPSNVVLVGMPGSGKSTVGVILAKLTSRDFIDTDILIQNTTGRSLQSILVSDGYLALRSIEKRILCGLECRNHVIATGGSAVYSQGAMEHLRADGTIVFLDVDLAVLESRDLALDTRGIAKRPEQSFAELFEERFVLYSAYADLVIACSTLSHEGVCARILDGLPRRCGLKP